MKIYKILKPHEIVIAYFEGEKIEFKHSYCDWTKLGNPIFDFCGGYEYRIKKEKGHLFWKEEIGYLLYKK